MWHASELIALPSILGVGVASGFKVLASSVSSFRAVPPVARVFSAASGEANSRALFNGNRFEYSNPIQGLKTAEASSAGFFS